MEEKLQMKFKNIRRPTRAAKADIVVEPQAKKLKINFSK